MLRSKSNKQKSISEFNSVTAQQSQDQLIIRTQKDTYP